MSSKSCFKNFHTSVSNGEISNTIFFLVKYHLKYDLKAFVNGQGKQYNSPAEKLVRGSDPIFWFNKINKGSRNAYRLIKILFGPYLPKLIQKSYFSRNRTKKLAGSWFFFNLIFNFWWFLIFCGEFLSIKTWEGFEIR